MLTAILLFAGYKFYKLDDIFTMICVLSCLLSIFVDAMIIVAIVDYVSR